MSKLVIDKSRNNIIAIFIMLLLYVIIKPEGLNYSFNGIDKIFRGLNLVILLVFTTLTFLKNRKISLISLLFIIFNAWLVYVTQISKPEHVWESIWNLVATSAVCMMFEYYKYDMTILISGFMRFYSSVIFINLLTIIATYPLGLYTRLDGSGSYFLGYRNAFILYYLPALMFALYYYYRKQNRYKLLTVYTISLLSILIEKSSTTLVALIVFALLFLLVNTSILLINKGFLLNKSTLSWSFVVYFILTTMIIFQNTIQKYEFVNFFIEKILGKSTTFTGRTAIWEQALYMISENKWLGYGVGGNIKLYGILWYGHNQIIELLLEGGYVALTIFMLIFFWLTLKVSASKLEFHYKIAIQILPIVLIFYLTEANTLVFFVPIYLFLTNLEFYIEKANLYKPQRRL